MSYLYFSALGQDSHRFENEPTAKELILGGVSIPFDRALEGNSDADIVLHALCNAISGLTTIPILGATADVLCDAGIKDSRIYLEKALETLGDIELIHLSFSIEAKRPKLLTFLPEIRNAVAKLCQLSPKHVAITATTGEGLTGMGQGEGMQCFCLASARQKTENK